MVIASIIIVIVVVLMMSFTINENEVSITFSFPTTANSPCLLQAQDVCVRFVFTTEQPRLVQPTFDWSVLEPAD